MPVFVFPDTNIWLHCRPFDQVDWNAILSDEDVRFVATDPLVRELDTLKYASRTRDRARGALSQIESWAAAREGVLVRPGVTGMFWVPERPPDIEGLGLDRNHLDDVLLAYACEFKRSHTASRIVVLSNDSGPRLTARRVGLEPLAPPDIAREPTRAESPEESELRRLRREVETLKNRAPRILLALKGGIGDGTRIEISRPQGSITSRDTYVRDILEDGRTRVPVIVALPRGQSLGKSSKDPKRSLDLADLAAQFPTFHSTLMPISDSEYARYESDRERYLSELEKVALVNWSILEERNRTIALDIVLLNNGNAPAEDVDIEIHAPDGPVVANEEAALQKLPKKPLRPRTLSEMMANSLSHSIRPFGPSMSSLTDIAHLGSQANISKPTIRRTSSYDVTVHVDRVKQHQALDVAHLALIFPNTTGPKSLELKYRLNSVSIPQPVTGWLHIIVKT